MEPGCIIPVDPLIPVANIRFLFQCMRSSSVSWRVQPVMEEGCPQLVKSISKDIAFTVNSRDTPPVSYFTLLDTINWLK